MAELKTKPTRKSVQKFLHSITHERRRNDAFELLELFRQVTGNEPVLWGDSIVGYGRYRYTYKSGHSGEWPVTGFSPRKQNLSLYVMLGFKNYQSLLAKLGKHKTARSCLYINKLDDIDLAVLRELLSTSVTDMRSTYPCS